MAFQGIDMLYDSKVGQQSGGLYASLATLYVNVEPASRSTKIRHSELTISDPSQVTEGVEAAKRLQP
jgi:hypothetical protein